TAINPILFMFYVPVVARRVALLRILSTATVAPSRSSTTLRNRRLQLPPQQRTCNADSSG
ncbi:hypothetical protein, partial [Stenotrophomonas maltophilia]|uniref:hypothetical protein n=1 Tax=Stenotrophomonas maltophilia TaxID=40324 RepID=UPI001952E76D